MTIFGAVRGCMVRLLVSAIGKKDIGRRGRGLETFGMEPDVIGMD